MDKPLCEHIVFIDVDGTLTDGTKLCFENKCYRNWNVRDGQGIAKLKKAGYEVVFLTSSGDLDIRNRAKDLGVTVLLESTDKLLDALLIVYGNTRLANEEGMKFLKDSCAFIGDDEMDIELLQAVGVAWTPADCDDSIFQLCDDVEYAIRYGGKGAVREFCEAVLLKWGA